MGFIPVVGDAANIAVDAVLGVWELGETTVEIAKLGTGIYRDLRTSYHELREVAEVEPEPQDSWLSTDCSNFTNRTTVPWQAGMQSWVGFEGDKLLAFDTVKAIKVQTPANLSGEDYVSLQANYQAIQLEIPLNPLELAYNFMSLSPKASKVQETVDNLGLASAPEHVFFNVHHRQGEIQSSDELGTGHITPDCSRSSFASATQGTPLLTATPGISASPAALAVAEGGSASYSVVLDSRPSANVRVSVNAPTRTDVRISPSSLTFEPSKWDAPQTVTVWALQDEDAAIDPFVTLAHTASGGGCTGTASENVVVVIEEDDVAAPSRAGPDLVVQSFSPSDATPEPSGRFTLNATVLNQGDEDASSSSLRYYLSTDTHISTSDTVVGTDGVSSLVVSRTGSESLTLNAPATAGTYYYGACVDPVAGEANTANNCSTVISVTVADQEPEEVITDPSEGDRGVLEALYNATGGPNWRAQRNWMSASPISSWRGVVVDANGNVTQLILAGYGLSGSIPPELGDLANLATLRLSSNSLTGCVPAALRNVPDNDLAALGLPFCGAAPITTGPQNGNRIFLDGGTLNDQPVNRANPTLTVGTGQAISGTVNLTVHKDHSAAARFPVVATPTWGDHGRSYWRAPVSAPAFGNADGTARVNLTAPGSPGEYAIKFVVQAQTTGGHVASATHWPSGGPRWNNGDDVASWSSAAIDSAIRNGYVLAPQQGWTQANGHFGAAAIRVIVTAAPVRMEAPDLVVETSSPGDPDAVPLEPFRFNATVRNQGDGESASTTLHYYRSTDSTIDTSDTPIGTDPISRLPASGRSNESMTMYAHPVGTLYYGACVDAVANETNTANNCTRGVAVTAIIRGVPPPSRDREVPVISRKTPSSPVSLTTGDRQSFSATATDADNNINAWEWFLDGVSQGGQSLGLTGTTTRRFSHTFSRDGTYTVRVEFTDSDGESASDTWTVRVTDDTPVNRAPVVSRKTPSSPVSLTTGDRQSFSATATDADNDINSWEWFLDGVSQGGQSLGLTGSTTRNFSYTFSSDSTYTVKVEFTDADGESASDTWTVRVTDDEPDNEAPVVSGKTPSSPVSLTVGQLQALSVGVSDPDNNVDEWEWFLNGESRYTESMAPTGSFIWSSDYSFASPGTYTVKVTFTDSEGASASESWTVRVTDDEPDNEAPVIDSNTPHSPVSLTTGDSQSFSATATDADNNINAWEWSWTVCPKAGSPWPSQDRSPGTSATPFLMRAPTR